MIIEASPWAESASLVAYGGDNGLTILRRTSSLGPTGRSGGIIESLRFSHVSNFAMSGRVTCLAFSPQSSADERSCKIALGAACSDHSVQYRAANENDTNQLTLLGHLDYVNSIAFASTHGQTPTSGAQDAATIDGAHLASTSDDHTIYLWNLERGEAVRVLPLKSAGMSVKFHREEPFLMMAAEASGDLSIFDVRAPASVAYSLYTPHSALLDADWNPLDPALFGCVANRRWLIFDARGASSSDTSSHPSAISEQLPSALEGPTQPGPLSKFRWSHMNANLFATLQAPSTITIWDTANPDTPISDAHNNARFGGLTWMQDRACLLASSHRSISFTLL